MMVKNVAKAPKRKVKLDQSLADRQIIARDFLLLLEGREPLDVLRRAALVGDLTVAKLLVELGTDINAPDPNGRTALIEAAFGGQTEVVKLLISCGVDVNAKDRDGWTALMEAASKGRLEIVRVLLKAGANVNQKNNQGMIALDMAAKGHLNLSRSLKEAAIIKAELHSAGQADYSLNAPPASASTE
jgi:ankyrin repeat protein